MMLDELRDGGEARPFEAVLTLPEKRETSFKQLNVSRVETINTANT